MPNRPEVSVIIPTYNRAAVVGQAVQSVLAQSDSDLEVIIVDDGSSDDTAEAAAAFASDGRVRYVRQANQGRSLARNHGARLAQGDWLGFLDSDDRYLPETLSRQREARRLHPEAELTLGGYEYVDEGGDWRGERRPWEEGSLTLAGWLFNCLGMPGSMLVRRSWFERLGGFDPECEIAEDWDLFLRLSHAGCGMAWTQTAVCQYRQHPGNSTHALERHCQGSLRALDKLLSQPELPPEITQAGPRARAWVYTVFARRAFQAGDRARGREYVVRATEVYRPFGDGEKVRLLECLLAESDRGEALASNELAAHLGTSLPFRADELRRAQARAAMAAFFRLRGRAPGEAGRHLKAGLKLDPRWLANRGVLSFIARRAFSGANQ